MKNHNDDEFCPKVERIAVLETEVKILKERVEGLRQYVIENAENRIYLKGKTDGENKSRGGSKLSKIINYAVTITGTVVILFLIGLILYLLFGAEIAINFFKFIYKGGQ